MEQRSPAVRSQFANRDYFAAGGDFKRASSEITQVEPTEAYRTGMRED